ncbi:SpoIIE family protein phosphatase [Streptomyces rapamycinicus]|uniref:Signal transduction histidine kinase n=2 Tax=Streptomyces rapamycinicus TaxID=1226757 RepID=A0A0A0NWS7_STRRN|nr:SpoIIE family protein phosphatase [Streptomyces rapamycinicus]AGP60300.1 magnesium or manganese-dependent protein phosphatase [Streptomyces rapamycinicus NRRL 5491]MBB4788536.1 PAS domain S-box-containing protein [Streptomyces rapamycinicus]RLV72868.1 signal transduction histidine kinase [Streptomyces rapamycinicus NRRL 5491]UTP35879.1 SpoIIE family protein phosphatase [Streptomyces rapamycinicus NRRL 5491]
MTRPDTPRDEWSVRSGDLLGEGATAKATVDEHGIVTQWNEAARGLLGYRPAEIVGRPVAELLQDSSSARAEVPAALRSPSPPARLNGRVTLLRRDGSTVRLGLLAHRRTSSAGAPEWLIISAVPRAGDAAGDEELMRRSFLQGPCTMAVCDTGLRLRWANHDLERVMGLEQAEMRGLRIPEILPGPESESAERTMRRALETGEGQRLELATPMPGHPRPLAWSAVVAPLLDGEGRTAAVMLSAHDTTAQLTARQRLTLLNEASVRIGGTLDIDRTAQELADVAVPALADFVTVDLLPAVHDGGEPRPGPPGGHVLLRRVACRSVFAGCPEAVLEPGQVAAYPEFSPAAECLKAERAMLNRVTDPAVARWADEAPERAAMIRRFGLHSTMAVPMRARGTTLGVATFSRHRRPEPFEQDDLLLAEEMTARAAVCVDNARRYTHERHTALALQRSLLPRTLPPSAAVEVASSYRPADSRSGVGGDWFDVIRLSGARVALVVGDVVGHGVRASAAMGRLRTAVRTLADVDLAPDELLTHLDDLINHLSEETENDDGGADPAEAVDSAEAVGVTNAQVGATCLYAVYDPVSRRCSLARAGHPPPVLVTPDGTATLLDLPGGPPLGLGSLPFEKAELELPEGSLLALYTDGLIESRDRDVDRAIDTLRATLARPAAALDGLCQAVLTELLPGHPTDDIALLLARTRGLDADSVATWQLPDDPAVVARARREAAERLAAWGLEEAAFTMEVVVSELVTNAIRHATPPIGLRLIRDRALICEVSDGSATAPHLRRARAFDEGGRGLLLVAQLTESWGTRQTATGKTIWAELAMPAP